MSLQKRAASLLAISLALFFAASAFSQYGSVGGVGSTGTSGGYQPPKAGYSSSTGIAIGAAAAAGGGLAYLALRNRQTLVGCIQAGSNGLTLLNEKDRTAYGLTASKVALVPGQRVALRGKKAGSHSGTRSFKASKLVKNYGSCKQENALR